MYCLSFIGSRYTIYRPFTCIVCPSSVLAILFTDPLHVLSVLHRFQLYYLQTLYMYCLSFIGSSCTIYRPFTCIVCPSSVLAELFTEPLHVLSVLHRFQLYYLQTLYMYCLSFIGSSCTIYRTFTCIVCPSSVLAVLFTDPLHVLSVLHRFQLYYLQTLYMYCLSFIGSSYTIYRPFTCIVCPSSVLAVLFTEPFHVLSVLHRFQLYYLQTLYMYCLSFIGSSYTIYRPFTCIVCPSSVLAVLFTDPLHVLSVLHRFQYYLQTLYMYCLSFIGSSCTIYRIFTCIVCPSSVLAVLFADPLHVLSVLHRFQLYYLQTLYMYCLSFIGSSYAIYRPFTCIVCPSSVLAVLFTDPLHVLSVLHRFQQYYLQTLYMYCLSFIGSSCTIYRPFTCIVCPSSVLAVLFTDPLHVLSVLHRFQLYYLQTLYMYCLSFIGSSYAIYRPFTCIVCPSSVLAVLFTEPLHVLSVLHRFQLYVSDPLHVLSVLHRFQLYYLQNLYMYCLSFIGSSCTIYRPFTCIVCPSSVLAVLFTDPLHVLSVLHRFWLCYLQTLYMYCLSFIGSSNTIYRTFTCIVCPSSVLAILFTEPFTCIVCPSSVLAMLFTDPLHVLSVLHRFQLYYLQTLYMYCLSFIGSSCTIYRPFTCIVCPSSVLAMLFTDPLHVLSVLHRFQLYCLQNLYMYCLSFIGSSYTISDPLHVLSVLHRFQLYYLQNLYMYCLSFIGSSCTIYRPFTCIVCPSSVLAVLFTDPLHVLSVLHRFQLYYLQTLYMQCLSFIGSSYTIYRPFTCIVCPSSVLAVLFTDPLHVLSVLHRFQLYYFRPFTCIVCPSSVLAILFTDALHVLSVLHRFQLYYLQNLYMYCLSFIGSSYTISDPLHVLSVLHRFQLYYLQNLYMYCLSFIGSSCTIYRPFTCIVCPSSVLAVLFTDPLHVLSVLHRFQLYYLQTLYMYCLSFIGSSYTIYRPFTCIVCPSSVLAVLFTDPLHVLSVLHRFQLYYFRPFTCIVCPSSVLAILFTDPLHVLSVLHRFQLCYLQTLYMYCLSFIGSSYTIYRPFTCIVCPSSVLAVLFTDPLHVLSVLHRFQLYYLQTLYMYCLSFIGSSYTIYRPFTCIVCPSSVLAVLFTEPLHVLSVLHRFQLYYFRPSTCIVCPSSVLAILFTDPLNVLSVLHRFQLCYLQTLYMYCLSFIGSSCTIYRPFTCIVCPSSVLTILFTDPLHVLSVLHRFQIYYLQTLYMYCLSFIGSSYTIYRPFTCIVCPSSVLAVLFTDPLHVLSVLHRFQLYYLQTLYMYCLSFIGSS